MELGYWIASRDTEMIMKIFIPQFSATFSYNLQLNSFFLKFFGHFRVNLSSRANENFSGLAAIILNRFQKQKLILKLFLKQIFLKGKNFALGLKASSFSNEYIWFSFDSFSFSIFEMILFVFWLALFNWSAGQVEYVWVFHSIVWIIFQNLSCYVFFIRVINFLVTRDLRHSQKFHSHSEIDFSLLFI